MKASNRKTSSSIRLTTVLAASLLATSGLVMGSASAESRPTPVPHRGTLFSGAQIQAPQVISQVRTEDTSTPWQIDPRRDGRN